MSGTDSTESGAAVPNPQIEIQTTAVMVHAIRSMVGAFGKPVFMEGPSWTSVLGLIVVEPALNLRGTIVFCQCDEGRSPGELPTDRTLETAATADETVRARRLHNSSVYRCEVEVFPLANSEAIG